MFVDIYGCRASVSYFSITHACNSNAKTSSNQRLVECVRQDTRKGSEARGAEAHGMALTSFAPEKFSGGAKLPTSYSP